MSLFNQYLYEFHIFLIGAFGWSVVHSAGGEFVLGVLHHGWVIEICQHGEQCPSVPVVCDTAPVITLPGQVANSVIGDRLILINKHLKIHEGTHMYIYAARKTRVTLAVTTLTHTQSNLL